MPIEISTKPHRDIMRSLWRGFLLRCPACGEGRMFRSYLKVNDNCPVCHEELHHHRADDAPPYFTIIIVAHVIVGGLLWMEKAYHPELWLQAVVWLPLTLILSLALLPLVKGALIGLQWSLYMHGFDPDDREDEAFSDPRSVKATSAEQVELR